MSHISLPYATCRENNNIVAIFSSPCQWIEDVLIEETIYDFLPLPMDPRSAN